MVFKSVKHTNFRSELQIGAYIATWLLFRLGDWNLLSLVRRIRTSSDQVEQYFVCNDVPEIAVLPTAVGTLFSVTC